MFPEDVIIMADLLGSILGSMEKPPTIGDDERKKAKEQKKQLEKLKIKEKEKLSRFREQTQKRISAFLKDGTQQKYRFEAMDKMLRAIIHEVAETAGLTAFSFGADEEDNRYVMLWKKEFPPSDEEVAAYRQGEEWDPERSKLEATHKMVEEREETSEQSQPQTNYKDKYEHLIGRTAAKDAAQVTAANKAYGFVSSENKRDRRTIEQVMADTRARKKQKTTE